jgi:hypothetical protein
MTEPTAVPLSATPEAAADTQPEPSVGRPRTPIVLACVAFGLFSVLLPLVHVPLRSVSRLELGLAGFAATLVFMLLLLCIPWTMAAARPRTRVAAILGLGMLAAYPGILFVVPKLQAALTHHAIVSRLLGGLWQAVAFGLVGIALSQIVREAKLLLPLGLVLGLIDIVGAMMPVGFTANVIQSHPEVVKAVSVPVPTFGSLTPIGYVGPGDALFLGFFFSVVHRFRMNKTATFWVTYALLTVAMVLVLVFGFNVAALFPMGLAVILANLRYFRYSREETFAMVYASGITLLAAVGFFLYTNHHVFHH